MRASKSLTSAPEYLELARQLDTAGLPGEAKSVLDEAVAAGKLYRAALAKSGVDANLVNTRLGIALAASGDKAGAEAAFKAVTGPRAELANLWVAWLSRTA